jgi:tetratricopeptide (TPR) repeat protein
VAELRKVGQRGGAEANAEEAKAAAEALLLNERPAEGLEMLLAGGGGTDLAFEVLVNQFRHAEALRLAEHPKETDGPTLRVLEVRRARLLYSLGDTDAALTQFERAGDEICRDKDEHAAKELVRSLHRLGLTDRALDECGRFLAVPRGASGDGVTKLLEPLFGKRAEAADHWWRHLRRQSPGEAPGQTLRRVRDVLQPVPGFDPGPAAEKYAREAEALAPAERGPELAAVAEAFRAAGRDRAALSYLEKAAEGAESAEPPLRLGDFLMEKHHYPAAAVAYQRAWSLNQGEPLPLYLRGLALVKAGEAREGRRLMDLAHWLPLGNEALRTTMAEELTKRGHADAAAKERELVLQCGWYRSWQVGNLLNMQARAALARKDYATAADCYERGVIGCLRSGARFVEPAAYLVVPAAVHSNRARALAAAGKVAEALREAEKALAAVPGNSDLVGDLIAELDRHGERAEADALFGRLMGRLEKLTGDYPRSAWAHNACAWLSAESRRGLDAALDHARKATELEPKNAGYLDTLAEVHFRRGERDQAVATAQRCTNMDPRRDYFRKQLARFKTGDPNSDVPVGEEE